MFHFDFQTYAKMIRLAWGEPNATVRRYYLALLLLWIPVAASFHALCFLLDYVFFPGLRRVQVDSPVFVLGHARSGTTLLHRLMSADGDRFSSFVLYELYFPSLLQKTVIRAVARIDRAYLGEALGKRVGAWEDKRYARMRKVHEMGLTMAEEDDLVFYFSCASGFWISKMPYMGDLDFYYVDEWPPRRRRRLMRFYRECVKRQLYLNGTGKIHLSKNPVFAGRIDALLETFPDARFVVPVRDPRETVPSLLKLVTGGWKRLAWDPDRVRRCQAVLAGQSFHTYLYPLEQLESRPGVRYCVVDYRELTADPEAAVSAVYESLELPMSDTYRAWLSGQSKRERTHKSGHSYSLEEFGLDENEITDRLGPLFERFGWHETGVEAS